MSSFCPRLLNHLGTRLTTQRWRSGGSALIIQDKKAPYTWGNESLLYPWRRGLVCWCQFDCDITESKVTRCESGQYDCFVLTRQRFRYRLGEPSGTIDIYLCVTVYVIDGMALGRWLHLRPIPTFPINYTFSQVTLPHLSSSCNLVR